MNRPAFESDPAPPNAAVPTPSTPKDAAAVILLRHDTDHQNPEVFWVRRSERLAFLGGFYAFPGGQVDASDAEALVLNSPDEETAIMISCAARELFEELGVLAARKTEALTSGQRASLLDDLESGRMSWPSLLRHYDLYLDARDFTFVGRWVTPPFSARRFDTWFFLVNCPAKQEPCVIPGELESGEWTTARAGYGRWQQSEVLAVPPTLHALRTLAEGLTADLIERFLSAPNAHSEPVRRIEFRPHYICFPVRTPTKPPATHTNCYLIYTTRELLIIDPGSPYDEERQALADGVDQLLTEGRTLKTIILTHVHPDHVAGVSVLREHLMKTWPAATVTVAAHRLTAAGLPDDVRVESFIEDGEVIELSGDPQISLQALHTPGHARGHLCLHEARTGTLLTGDNIVGLGSVLIDPPEGNMRDYLASLERLRTLPDLSVLFPGHGPAIANPYKKIDEYINHRLEREQLILQAVRDGVSTPAEIVGRVYTDVSPKAHPMAERAVLAHLEKLIDDGLISTREDKYTGS